MRMQGFTLLELLTTLAVAVILLGVGVPGFISLLENVRADNTAQTIYRGFQVARATAITTQQTLTVCGSRNGSTCSREWGRYFLIFADENDNKTGEAEELIRLEDLGFDESRITTKMALGLPYTRIKPDGSVSFQGSMTYCAVGKPESIRRVTWNIVGRPYLGRDTDGDGFVNAANGEQISC
jgi:type IV fimbrial biogenesis protein FimT